MTISLRKARTIIRKTFEKGREMELKPLSVVVLDAGGHVIAFEREDNAAPGRFAIAHGKAYGSVMLGMAGTAQMQRAEDQAYFMNAINGLYGGAGGASARRYPGAQQQGSHHWGDRGSQATPPIMMPLRRCGDRGRRLHR